MNTDKIFRRELLKRSQSKIWHVALSEWSLISIRQDPNGFKCICTQDPAFEACLIHNNRTLIGIEIGNTCVEKVCSTEYWRLKYQMRKRWA